MTMITDVRADGGTVRMRVAVPGGGGAPGGTPPPFTGRYAFYGDSLLEALIGGTSFGATVGRLLAGRGVTPHRYWIGATGHPDMLFQVSDKPRQTSTQSASGLPYAFYMPQGETVRWPLEPGVHSATVFFRRDAGSGPATHAATVVADSGASHTVTGASADSSGFFTDSVVVEWPGDWVELQATGGRVEVLGVAVQVQADAPPPDPGTDLDALVETVTSPTHGSYAGVTHAIFVGKRVETGNSQIGLRSRTSSGGNNFVWPSGGPAITTGTLYYHEVADRSIAMLAHEYATLGVGRGIDGGSPWTGGPFAAGLYSRALTTQERDDEITRLTAIVTGAAPPPSSESALYAFGESGRDSADLASRTHPYRTFMPTLQKLGVTTFITQIQTNDRVISGTTIPDFKANYSTAANQVHSSGIPNFVAVLMPNTGGNNMEPYREALRQLHTDGIIDALIDASMMPLTSETVVWDGLHWTDAGAAIFAEIMAAALGGQPWTHGDEDETPLVGLPMTVTATTPDGTTRIVRGWDQALAPGTAIIIDHEADLGRDITYQIIIDRQVRDSVVLRLDSPSPLITDPIRGRHVPVTIQAWPEATWSRAGHTLTVPGRRRPIILEGIEQEETSAITLLHVWDPTSAADLEVLLADASVVCIRPTCSYLPTVWASARDRRRHRFSGRPDSALVDQLELLHTDPPYPDMAAVSSTLGELHTYMMSIAGPAATLGSIHAHWPGSLVDIAYEALT